MKLAGNQLLAFPNDRLDILASLLQLDVSRNHISHLPTDLPYLYRVQHVSLVYYRHHFILCDFKLYV